MRKVFSKKTEDKSVIKLKQQEISRSVNELELTSQRLTEDNINSLEELTRKEDQHIVIDKKTDEFLSLMNDAEKDYIKSKNKLDELNSIISWVETKNKDKLEESERIEKEFNDKKEKLENDSWTQEESLLAERNLRIAGNKLLWEDKDKLITQKKDLTVSIDKLSKIEDDKDKIIKEQDKKLKSYKSEIDKLEDVYISDKLRNKLLDWDIKDLEDEKESKQKDVDRLKKELSDTSFELTQSKNELTSTRETNVKLVKKEENLNSKAAHIKSVYEKAGIKINL